MAPTEDGPSHETEKAMTTPVGPGSETGEEATASAAADLTPSGDSASSQAATAEGIAADIATSKAGADAATDAVVASDEPLDESRSEPSSEDPATKPTFENALRRLVSIHISDEDDPSEVENIAAALRAVGKNPAGVDRLWVAAALMFGVPAEEEHHSVQSHVQQAESVLLGALQSEEAIAGCPDCAALWAFGRLRGAFAPLKPNTPIALVARDHRFPEPAAAAVVGAQFGGPMSRLFWGELRAGGAIAWQHEAAAEIEEAFRQQQPWSWLSHGAALAGSRWPQQSEDELAAGCRESLNLAMSVAQDAMSFEHTPVPQPLDLPHFEQNRRIEQMHYAFATHLAEDGSMEGLAAKAEMLFYGKKKVVPGGGKRGQMNVSTMQEHGRTLAVTLMIGLLGWWSLKRCHQSGRGRGGYQAGGAAAMPHNQAAAAAAAAAAGAGGPAYRAPVENPLDADNLRQLQEAAGGIRFGQVLKFIVGLIALSSCLMALDIVDVSQMQEYSAELLTKEGLLKLGTNIKEELSSLVGIASKASTAVSPGMGDLMKDEDEAKELFKIAALNGHWGAAFALAMIELDGPDRSTAIPWLKMVAEHGDESSRAFCLHFMHRWGLGKEKDARLAGKYLVEAAEKGDANAVLLLAEANSQEFSEDSEVIPPGGPNHTQALIHFRSAASKGRSTGRFNIGVLLTRVHPMHKMNSAQCRETKAEFVEVATDLEPNLRLLFALALRSFEFGESESALGLFMFLSELGSNKAHRNAAQLWENLILPGAQAVELATEQVQPPSLAAPGQPKTLPAASTGSESVEVDEAALPKVMSDSDGKTSELEVNHSDADPDIVADFGKETDTDTSSRVTPKQVDKEEPAQAAPAPPPPSKGQPTPLTIPITLGMSEDGRPLVGSFEEKMAGRFCCSKFACQEASSAPSDTCGCDWLVNEWLSDPVDCLQRCASDQRCRYATIYGSGFCQLSEECGSAVQAGDSSAQTFELKRPQELQPEPTGFQWCWPPTPETQTRENARRCAASFFARAAAMGGSGGPDPAPYGSAVANLQKRSEEAALAATRHLHLLGRLGEAHDWACLAAEHFGSEHGRLQCHSLEGQVWEGHARNMSGALQGLWTLAAEGRAANNSQLQLSAYAAVGSLFAEFGLTAARGCRPRPWPRTLTAPFVCPDFDRLCSSWAMPAQIAVQGRARFEMIVTIVAALGLLLALTLLWQLRRCFCRRR